MLLLKLIKSDILSDHEKFIFKFRPFWNLVSSHFIGHFLTFQSVYYYDFWRSCDTEDWSNDAENTQK